jgi:hypothetical protein
MNVDFWLEAHLNVSQFAHLEMANGKMALLAYWGLHTRHDDIAFGPGSTNNERASDTDDNSTTLQ